MKIKNLILSIALVALATTLFGQLSSLKERLFPNRSAQVTYCYEAPIVSRTILADQPEIIFEEELGLESWMTTPFENSIAEEELTIESWMTAPFEAAEIIEVEDWMAAGWI